MEDVLGDFVEVVVVDFEVAGILTPRNAIVCRRAAETKKPRQKRLVQPHEMWGLRKSQNLLTFSFFFGT